MSVVSLPFAAFVAAALAIYHALPAARRAQWLLLTSYGFAVLCGGRFAVVLPLVTIGTAALARRVRPGQPRRRMWLAGGVAAIVATLFGLRSLFHADPFAAPFVVVGLSFYSLQAIAYLADVSTARSAEVSVSELALYLAYFPKLVAGPIERAPAFLARAARPAPVDDQRLAGALALILIGMSRKLLLADPLNALLPADVFTAPQRFGALALATYLVAAVFALYNDFAGYTGIVRGVSRLFGIELSANFDAPFFARSFAEVWTRWHITLSAWLRDYIYLPLSRALLHRDPRLTNLSNLLLPPMASLLASGVWHGAGLGFVIWGGLHGAFLVGERALALLHHAPPPALRPRWQQITGAVVVFVLGTFAFAFFRMNLDPALTCWSRLLQGAAGAPPDVRVLALMLPSLAFDWRQYRSDETAGVLRWPRALRLAAAAAVLLLCFLSTRRQAPTPFVYQSF